jgi:hypothetical protein
VLDLFSTVWTFQWACALDRTVTKDSKNDLRIAQNIMDFMVMTKVRTSSRYSSILL